MNFPVTVVMKKAKKKIQRAEARDENALRYLADWIMTNWRKGYSFKVLQSE
jgi:hypothetical protein